MPKLKKLRETIANALEKIATIQEECSHPTKYLTKQYRSNTGNYDPDANCYWINWSCSLCEKRWETDQDAENVNREAGVLLR